MAVPDRDVMKPTLRTSAAGRRLIKSFEGFRAQAEALPGGGWVIGYGHTRSAREGATVSRDDADKLLTYDLLPIEAAINEHVAVPLNQNQFDALASLALNIGRERFLNSTILKRLSDNRPLEAAMAFDQWRATLAEGKPVVDETLLRRRAAERALFLTPAPAAATQAAETAPATEPAPEGEAARPEAEPAAAAEPEAEASPEIEPVPEPEPAAGEAPPAAPPIETAIDPDEPMEEVFVAPAPDAVETPADALEDADRREAPAQAVGAERAQAVSWVDLAEQRALLARASAAAPPPTPMPTALPREDVLRRATGAQWELDDENELAEEDRGEIWYALFLGIGAALAAFGVWDTWQRATGAVEEAFVYGPAIAAAGVLFMAIAGWFLIKRVLAFR